MSRLTRLSFFIASIALVVIVSCGGGAKDEAATDTVSPASPVSAASPATPDIQPNRLIKLVDPLDDPDHYCIDIRGFGSNIQLQNSLQAHTCKPNNNRDEQFTTKSQTGQLMAEQYNLCMQPESPVDGSQIYLRDCADTSLQGFSPLEDGTIGSVIFATKSVLNVDLLRTKSNI